MEWPRLLHESQNSKKKKKMPLSKQKCTGVKHGPLQRQMKTKLMPLR